MPLLKFKFLNQIYELEQGIDLIDACKRNHHIPIRFGCRSGECAACLLQVIEGHRQLSPMTKQERKTLSRLQKDPGSFRLACQCAIKGDVEVS